MQLQRVLESLRALAPEHLAESWDHVGLQLGDPRWPVRRAMLCVDLVEPVLAEARRRRVDLVVAYHPPIFQPLAALTAIDPAQGLLLAAARSRIAIYSPHTALDAADGGVNDWLCAGLGPGTATPIRAGGDARGLDFKLVTFVPASALAAVRAAMSDAGAGRIGGYEQCSFAADGEGSFRGGASTRPAVGRRGRLETVPERRLEMVCPRRSLDAVLAALRAAHPYEEPAFDILRLEPAPAADGAGQGRLLALDQPVSATALARRVRRHLASGPVRLCPGRRAAVLRRIGVCAGAGGDLWSEAADLDAWVTGEMRHHDLLAALRRGITVVLAGHTQTERPYLAEYRRRLRRKVGSAVAWLLSRADRAPGCWA